MLIFAIIAGIAFVAISAFTIVSIRRAERRDVRHPFPLIRAVGPGQVGKSAVTRPRPAPVPLQEPPVTVQRPVPVLEPPPVPVLEQPDLDEPLREVPRRMRKGRKSPSRSQPGVADVPALVKDSADSDSTATVRFRRPGDHAVQLLPGRLEVVAGESHHKEIRLVRGPGERPEVILGRELADAPGHIVLHSSTVSRRHALLAYANGKWKVANLSQTNPVIVNDEALSAQHGERILADGDCLELGEVVLRFHAS